MVVKLFVKTILISTILAGVFCTVQAEQILNDTFTDTANIDMVNTTAEVDTEGEGEVRLKLTTFMPNLVAVKYDAYEYAVATSTGEDFYRYDGTQMVKDNSKSITGLTGVMGVAVRQDTYSVWMMWEQGIDRYDYVGGVMQKNAALHIPLLPDVVGFSAYPYEDRVVILTKNGTFTTYMKTEQGNMQPNVNLTFATGIEEPTAVSIVPGCNDIAVAWSDAVRYYSHIGGAEKYRYNSSLSVTSGLDDVRSITCLEDGYGYQVTTGTQSLYYLYDEGTDSMVAVSALTVDFGEEPVCTSARIGSYEFIARMKTDSAKYYVFDADLGRMRENPGLGKSGLSPVGGGGGTTYITPAEYYSTVKTTVKKCRYINLDVTEDLPAGTQVQYYIKCGDETTFPTADWMSILPEPTEVPESDRFCLRAVLSTNDVRFTPRIQSVLLTAEDLGVIPPEPEVFPEILTPVMKMTTVPDFTFQGTLPVYIKAGAQAVFHIRTTGGAETVDIVLATKFGEMVIPTTNYTIRREGMEQAGQQLWVGTYTVPPNAEEGSEIWFDKITLKRGTFGQPDYAEYIYGDDEPDIQLLEVANSVLYESEIIISE